MPNRNFSLCARCGVRLVVSTMSFFDSSVICPHCEAIEREHPRYQEARKAELAALRRGDFNSPGIGVPKDLTERCREARRRREAQNANT